MQPFYQIEIFDRRSHLCCPSWVPKRLNHKILDDGSEDYDVWNSETAQKIRKSVLDGSYSYCNKSLCPHLSTLLNTGEPTAFMIEKSKLPFKIPNGYEITDSTYVNTTPGSINFTFDQSCNLKCPSCRLDTIMAKPEDIKRIDKTIEFIRKKYATDVKKIQLTGSGDPFASKSFRNFMFNFDPNEWPNLDDINLTTNGILFNEKNWGKMKSAQPFVKTVEISIDACTARTYENETRVGGKWDVLMENLDFISTLDSIQHLRLSFVVQNNNYKEMFGFAMLMLDKFKSRIKYHPLENSTVLYFGKIAPWPHISKDDFYNRAVWKEEHVNYLDFVHEVRKLYVLDENIQIQSNFTDLL